MGKAKNQLLQNNTKIDTAQSKVNNLPVLVPYDGDLEIVPSANDIVIGAGTWLQNGLTIKASPIVIDGQPVGEPMNLISETKGNVNLPDIPYVFSAGQAVRKGEGIYIFGSNNAQSATKFYYYNPTQNLWVNVNPMLYDFFFGSAVLYRDELHVLGGGSGTTNTKAHKKWNNYAFENVSTLPFDFKGGSAVVYNDEIHIFGGTLNPRAHWKFNGSQWINVSTLPFDFSYGVALVYNNEIHILGGTAHKKLSGSQWVNVSTLPYNFTKGNAVVAHGEIHILGGEGNTKQHYAYKTSWKKGTDLPHDCTDFSAVPYKGGIALLGGANNGSKATIIEQKIYMEA